jgi:hypothetical protein
LTFSHHCVVASLRADEQTEWLDKAANRKLSVRALRESIKDRRDRDVGENPELEAEYWAERLYEVAQKSQRFGWDQPERLKLLRAETLDRLIKITNETAQYWDQAARGLEQYRRPGRERIRATNQVAETAAD